MAVELYQQIALARDIPDQNLRRGDVATVVEFLPHPAGGAVGCVLEIFNAVGDTLTVTTVAITDVEPLRADEVLSVRPLARAG